LHIKNFKSGKVTEKQLELCTRILQAKCRTSQL